MLAKTNTLDMLLGSGSEIGVPDAYALANQTGSVNTDADAGLTPTSPDAQAMCGMQGVKDIPSLTSQNTKNAIDPFASSISKVNVTGISPADLTKNIPLAATTPSFLDRVKSAVGTGLNVLGSLPLGQMSQFAGMASSIMGKGNNFFPTVNYGNTQNFIPPNMLGQAQGLTNMINAFTRTTGNNNSGVYDRAAAAGALGGIFSQAGRINVGGAVTQSAVGVPRPIIDTAVSGAAASVVGAGALGALSEMSAISSPGVIKTAYPTAVQDFGRNYTPQVGNAYMSFPGTYNTINTMNNNIDPNWNQRQRNNNGNDPFRTIMDLSTIAGANVDYRKVMQIGASVNILSAYSNNQAINPADLFNAAGNLIPAPMQQSLSMLSNRFPEGFGLDPNRSFSTYDGYAAGGPGAVVPTDGSVGYGTVTPEMSEELNRLSPSNSSSANRNAAMMVGAGVTGYGDEDPMFSKPTGNPTQSVSKPENIAKTQVLLYGDEEEFEGADEEAAEAAKKPQITEVTVY